MRVGNGFDIHRLVYGRPLILGGIIIPFERGLEGHSDGDALTHAIIDALLGAAALGDIGMHFPSDDPQYRGANSIVLLKQVIQTVQRQNYHLVNIDSIVVCEKPRLSSFYLAIRESICKAVDLSLNCVSVKARTAEGLGHVGEGDAIAAQAVVLIK